MKHLIVLIALLMSSLSATAQEVPEPKMMLVRGGIMCDTKADLQTFLTKTSLNGGRFVEDHGTTCGRFVPEMPVPMMATPTEWYELPEVNILITHFIFLGNGWEQWGYSALIPNPNYVAPNTDPSA